MDQQLIKAVQIVESQVCAAAHLSLQNKIEFI